MKRHFLTLILLLNVTYLLGQKQIINTTTYNKWPIIGHASISNNGEYATYNVLEISDYKKERAVIKSLRKNWKLEFSKTQSDVSFTADSKYGIFLQDNDLHIIWLDNKSTKQVVQNVSDFIIPIDGSGEWLLYKCKGDSPVAVLKNLKTGKEKVFPGEFSPNFSEDGKILVLLKFVTENKKKKTELEWINLIDGKKTIIWEGSEIDEIIFDFANRQLAFKTPTSLWSFNAKMREAVSLTNSLTDQLNHNLKIGSLRKFSKDGTQLFFELECEKPLQPEINYNSVAVWSYLDKKLQSFQEAEIKGSNANSKSNFLYSVNLSTYHIIKLQQFNEELILFSDLSDDYLKERHRTDSGSTEIWRSGFGWSNNLINTKTGQRTQLDSILGQEQKDYSLSPKGDVLVFFDKKQRNYFSYCWLSGKSINLTKGLNTSWSDINLSDEPGGPNARGFAGWLEDGSSILVYDKYDIWKLDPQGKNRPTNLTNGLGVKNSIVFSLILFNEDQRPILQSNTRLILCAFNQITKENGFFSKKIGEIGDPEYLTMGPYIYNLTSPYINVSGGSEMRILKSKNSKQYLIRRMAPNEAPNYFVSKDLKSFTPLSNINPQNKYNWYSTELHTWNSLDGRKLQGILYKPENFDINKKYPVIFHFYERKTDGLNAFLYPKITEGDIDIPTYVSNGYLVFCPDIYYTIGDPMQGTFDAIVSGAKYLSKLSFVNFRKMGLQGHSWGAFQVNYLIAHTNIFAAACSSAGISNWVSGYGTIFPGKMSSGENESSMYENSQQRMGTTLWGNIPGYLKNSPVFFADKVRTPLLMEHGTDDGICPYHNALEYFLGLRRMGKKVWFLSYPNANHSLMGKDAVDFTIRMQQFFDHYLKDTPAPIWMTRGIAASSRGTDSGLELDSVIKTPGSGLLTPEEQRKVDSLITRKPITITLK